MTTLDIETITRTLLNARERLCTRFFLLLRDAHAAEDVFQTVVVRALRGGTTFPTEEALLAWTHVTGKRLAIDLLRKKDVRWEPLDDALLQQMEIEWEQRTGGDEAEVLQALRECLQTLPEKTRWLMELRYFEGRSGVQIARLLSASDDAVHQRLSRAHRLLRQCLEGKLKWM